MLNLDDPRIKYVKEILCEGLLVDSLLLYSSPINTDGDKCVCVVPSGFFGSVYGSVESLPTLPLQELNGIPVLFGTPKIERRGASLIVYADIIASSYFLLTRYEEWIRRDVRDEHGRFPGKASVSYRAGCINRPLVDEYAKLVRTWVRQLGIPVAEPKRRFSVLLTHDVDSMSARGLASTLRAIYAKATGRCGWHTFFSLAASSVGLGCDELDNLEQVIRLDSQLMKGRQPDACQAVYFFLAGGRGRLDRMYKLSSPRAKRWIENVRQARAQIGLHASYRAGLHPQSLSLERSSLEKAAGIPVTMNRHHYLRWRELEDGHYFKAAGISWDSTLGYADVAGFRLGTCRPISLFCPIQRKLLEIEEHPLIVMDCTLSSPKYMGLDEHEAFEYTRRLIDATRLYKGEFVVLWHNSSLARTHSMYLNHERLYKKILAYLNEVLE